MPSHSAGTAVLDPVADAAIAPAVAMTGVWNLDVERCAIEVSAAVLGVTLWRARLRPLDARVTFPEPDRLGDATDEPYVTIAATIASRASYASIPLTRDWFLPDTPPTRPIRLAGNAFARTAERGNTVYTLARATAEPDVWWARLSIRFIPVHEERVVLAITGSVPRRPDAPFPKTSMGIHAAAEFVRCA